MRQGVLLTLLLAAPLAAQSADPRPNECWGFVFGAWSPPLDWAAAGHAERGSHGAPPAPDVASTEGAPRHDAASFELNKEPGLVLYPTWWPVGVGIRLDRQPVMGDTASGVAHAFVADGRVTPPASRIRAWRTPCNELPERSVTRAAPDERQSLPAAPGAARRPSHRAGHPR